MLIAGAGSSCLLNTGDEAILVGMIKDLREHIPSVEFVLASRNPEGYMARYGIKEIPLGDIVQLIDAAKRSDLLILGGSDDPYEPPERPELVHDAFAHTVEENADLIIDLLMEFF